jgi:hypothetical protein
MVDRPVSKITTPAVGPYLEPVVGLTDRNCGLHRFAVFRPLSHRESDPAEQADDGQHDGPEHQAVYLAVPFKHDEDLFFSFRDEGGPTRVEAVRREPDHGEVGQTPPWLGG